jgi:aspartate-semialdehyde dehydrogenase
MQATIETSRSALLQDMPLVKSGGYIGGAWHHEGAKLTVTDPATGQEIAHVHALGQELAQKAVGEAQDAFKSWATLLPQDRALALKHWHTKIIENHEELAQIMVAEQGKPISEARGEVDYAASFVEYYAEEAKRANVEGITSHMPNAEVELWREPVGVVALITPWNFPSAMLTRKAAAAMAAGCTIVAHPSAETPLSALALAQLADDAGIPAGVFNVVPGDAKTIVTPWCNDTRVRALSFTGSTEIGRLLYGQCANTVKRLVMELGGHAPFIVFDDADLDHAVTEAVDAKFATSGQDCLGANRMFIARGIYEEFCARFTEAARRLTVGAGLDDPDIGPLMHERLVQKQESQVADALAKGASLTLGGKRHKAGPLFFEPTVLINVPADADIMRQETFGPVAALTPFDTEDEVTARANDTEYGLVAYVHTQDPKRIYRMSRALEFGMVAVNRTSVTGPPIPFGGVKQSGLGREGARHGLEEFTEIKYVCRDWS